MSWMEVDLGNVTASAGNFEDALELELRAEQTRQQSLPAETVSSMPIVVQNIGRCHVYLNQFNAARIRLDVAKHEFEADKNWAMLSL
jgi:hypothetical protein